jgi:hypothetical protein
MSNTKKAAATAAAFLCMEGVYATVTVMLEEMPPKVTV